LLLIAVRLLFAFVVDYVGTLLLFVSC